ncbi:MAG: hypothetical protein ABSD85_02900 [Acidimicrobiales bacterium]|jgi:hypothetical protein
MELLSAAHRASGGGTVLLVLLSAVIWIVAGFKVLPKVGYSRWLALLMIIPVVNLVMILIFAFSDWPVDKELRNYRQSGLGRPPQGGYPAPPWPGQPPSPYGSGAPQYPAPPWPPPPAGPPASSSPASPPPWPASPSGSAPAPWPGDPGRPPPPAQGG